LRMNRFAIFAPTLLIAALVLSVVATADQHSGTWKMNPAKSKYSPGPTPKDVTVEVDSDENGVRIDADGTNADGTASTLNTAQNSTAKITRLSAHTLIPYR
jgi:hypothetical protein